MAVGHVASATSGSQASVASFNIGTLGTGARAGIVFVVTYNSSTAKDTGVTWNGTSMSLLYSATDNDTEPGVVRAYFLDNVTNGTITVTRTNDATVTVGYAASISTASLPAAVAQVITRAGSTQNTDADTTSGGTGASGEVAVDDGSPGSSSLRYAAYYCGAATPPAQGTNSTSLASLDGTSLGSRFVRETTAGQGSRSVGAATGTTDDWALVAVAVKEDIKNLVVPLLDASNALYAPTVSNVNQDLVVPLLDASNALYAPTVDDGVYLLDDFSDDATGGWGNLDRPTSNNNWVTSGTGFTFAKASGVGTITATGGVTGSGSFRPNTANTQNNQECTFKFKIPAASGAGTVAYLRIGVRYNSGAQEGYVFYLHHDISGLNDITIRKRSGGSTSTLQTFTDALATWDDTVFYNWKHQVENSGSDVVLRLKIWKVGDSEPGTWTASYTDTAPGTPYQDAGYWDGTWQLLDATFAATNPVIQFDDLSSHQIPSATGPQTLTVPLLDSSPALYAPTVSPDQFLTVPLLESTPALYEPTVSPDQFLTVPLLDAVAALYEPTLTPKNTLTVPLLDAVAALYEPTVVQDQFLTVPLLDAVAALYEPTVTQTGGTPQDLTVPLLESTPALYVPTVTFYNTLTVPLLDSGPTLYVPTVKQITFVVVPLLDAGAALYVPTVTPKNTLTVPLLDASAALYVPTLTFYNTLTVPLLDSGPTLYEPTVVGGGGPPQDLTVPFLESTPALYVPTVTFYNTLTVPLLDAGNALYAPTAIQDQVLVVPLLDASNALYVPTVTTRNSLTVPLLTSTATLYAPTLTQVSLVVVPLLDAGNALYAPTLGQTALLTVPLLDAVNDLYPPVLGQGYPAGWVFRLHDVAYHLVVYEPTGTGGPGVPKLDLTPDLLNVVWQAGLNLPEMIAFTLARENPKIAKINWMVDHFKLFREDSVTTTVLMAGKLVKPQFTASDVVILGWDYKAFLQLSRTGYNTEYPLKKLGTEIVLPEWTLAKNTASSPLEFVATGTVEDPLALDAVTPITTNDDFGVVMFNRLYTFFQIAEMGMANTSNTVVFEITRTAPHTFNFWKNKGQNTGIVLTSPGNLADHDYSPSYESIRNDRATVIVDEAATEDVAYVVDDSTSISSYKRLQDAVTIRTLLGLSASATEADQQKEAMARLLKEGIRLPKTVTIWPRQGEVAPFRTVYLADLVRVKLRDDATGALFDGNLRIIQMAGGWSPSSGEMLQLAGRGVD